jgi:rhodanese-related sulfurtransferase
MSRPRDTFLLVFLPALAGALLLAAGGCRSSRGDAENPGFRVRPPVAFEMLLDAPSLTILDLRQPGEFEGDLGHVYRAWNVPLEELPDRLSELGWLADQTFLVYCRGGDDCGERAMRIFLEKGFRDAVLIEGGVEAWLRDGYTTVGQGSQRGESYVPEDSGLRIPRNATSGRGKRDLPKPP